MRCILCEKLSFKGVCKSCLTKLLMQNRRTRVLDSGLKVYSFFSYDSIALILHVKHRFWGHRILKQIAKETFGKFAKEFEFSSPIYAIGIDDRVDDNYSHTAILVNAIKSKNIKPLYKVLRAKNSVKYSGKSYEYRRKNPRKFQLNKKCKSSVILIDDIITSGQTLDEAFQILKKESIDVLFALTLADAKN
ncbi:MAG: ComF family protein [Campylobacteraceae bacterium]|nr:ComF family protein [Campylobacteraceae bacterium]